MADNVTLPGTGKDIATDDIAGEHYQRVKLIHGADGVNGGDVSNANGFPVTSKGGVVSTDNSTTTELAADGVFTGTGEDVSQYSAVSVSWDSDVATAAGGLEMQFSTDNVNWDRVIPVSSHSDELEVDHGGAHRLAIIAKYFRIVYTNGSAIQGFFRLQCLFHTDNSLPLVSRMEQQLSVSSDCTLSRPITNIDLDLARRNITNQRAFFFFGSNDNISTSWEDIHPNGGDVNWLTTASTVEVLSTHAADTASGLGVQSVEVHGLSATGVDQSEVIALNGVTPVVSALTYIRINKMHNEEVGTYGGSHQGDVTCRVSGGGAVLSIMNGIEGAVDSSVQYGLGEANNGYWSVPLDKVLYITRLEVNINTTGTKTADIVLYEREGILDTVAPMLPRRVIWSAIEVQGLVTAEFKSHIKIKQLTDLWFRAEASNINTKIHVTLDFYLLDGNARGE